MTAVIEHVNGTTRPRTQPAAPSVPAVQAPPAPSTAPRALSGAERTAVNAVGWAVAVLGVLGFVNSFARVAAAARPSFGNLAYSLPLGVDLGILVFSGLDIVLARLDMRLVWLRLVPWTLTAATVYLNVADSPDRPPLSGFDRLAHGVLPGLWVLAVEVGAHVVRKRAGLASSTRMDKVRVSRWLLAPGSTAGLWRRMVLWEIRSYPSALGRERDRLLAKTDLQDRYGAIAWRWKAPRRARALYRLGELTPYTLLGGTPAPSTPTASTPTGAGHLDTADVEHCDAVDVDMPDRPTPTAGRESTSPDVFESSSTGGPESSSIGDGESASTVDAGSPVWSVRSTSTVAAPRDFAALLAEARKVDRWRGKPSAERIRTALRVGAATASKLAAELTVEDLAATSTVLDPIVTPTDTTTGEVV